MTTQPNVCCTQATTDAYAPSAQMSCNRGSRPRTRSNNTLVPSRSCTSAGSTTKPQISPSVSTNGCRLRPLIFFPRVVALGAADLGGLDRLAIHHGGAGGSSRGPPSAADSDVPADECVQRIQELE